MFGGVQFGWVGWQEQQTQASVPLDLATGMPTRLVQKQENAFVGSGAGEFDKSLEGRVKSINGHSRHQEPESATGDGLHKAIHIQPLVTVINRDHRALTPFAPDTPHNGFEPDAMFIHGPILDFTATQGCFEFFEDEADVFLNCSCTSTFALA